ncbi:uncharacterized protein LOC118751535 [Rhagoletis pomonella]|uniref:uncharacterized protein LOC118751535 n=1 Tax=Rhagoletis pomonella TaxID=28610 RepID=UPI001785B64C|nr:uncharacterized protein LOC118751535 [Rhagoletis pomonella]
MNYMHCPTSRAETLKVKKTKVSQCNTVWLSSSTTCASQHRFDWNSFVRDPGELSEARYPITLNTFKTMTYSINVAQRILEDIKNSTGLDFLSDQFIVDSFEKLLQTFL